MKTLFFAMLFCGIFLSATGQSVVGKWQLVKQSTCLEDQFTADDSTQAFVDEMKGMAGASPQVVTFRDNTTGEESTRILAKKKTVNNKNFLYRFDGEMLIILDKKSQTISDSYLVEKFSTDSLILANTSRPCETRIFLRVK